MIQDDHESQTKAAKITAGGGVIAFRTDTFYGLGADPFNVFAVRRIRELKGREDSSPILLLLSDANEADRFIAHKSKSFQTVAERFWPGPLTIVGVARHELSSELTSGTGTIGVRLPDDERVRALVRACGGALTATSANLSGMPPARTAEEVRNYFHQGIEMVKDDGEVTATQASTVVDLSAERARMVREGAVTREQLAGVVAFQE